jgi:hypothetical protein
VVGQYSIARVSVKEQSQSLFGALIHCIASERPTRRSSRQVKILTQCGAQRSIRPWVVKSGRKWVQPRSNTDHQQQLFLWATHQALSSGAKVCCEEITQARIDVKGRLKVPTEFRRLIEEKHGKDFYITSL